MDRKTGDRENSNFNTITSLSFLKRKNEEKEENYENKPKHLKERGSNFQYLDNVKKRDSNFQYNTHIFGAAKVQ